MCYCNGSVNLCLKAIGDCVGRWECGCIDVRITINKEKEKYKYQNISAFVIHFRLNEKKKLTKKRSDIFYCRCQWWSSNFFIYISLTAVSMITACCNGTAVNGTQWFIGSSINIKIISLILYRLYRFSDAEFPESLAPRKAKSVSLHAGWRPPLASLECCYTITGACYADLLRKLSKKIKKIWCGKLQPTSPQWWWLPSRNVGLNSSSSLPIHQNWPPDYCLFTLCWSKILTSTKK